MTRAAALAAALLAGAVLVTGAGGTAARRVRGRPAPVPPGAPAGSPGGPPFGPAALPVLAGAAALLGTRSVVLGVGCAALTAAGLRARRRAQLARRAARTRAAVYETCRATVAELRAGRAPDAALRAAIELLLPPLQPLSARGQPGPTHGRSTTGAAAAWPAAEALEPVLLAAAGGGDVATALRRAAGSPGAGGLGRLAVCWQVAAATGAGLAAAVDRVGDGLAAEEATRREVAAQVAGPRATAQLLLVLPGLGVLMGAGLGTDPVGWLLGTSAGRVCLVAGSALSALGAVWTDRLVRSALG